MKERLCQMSYRKVASRAAGSSFMPLLPEQRLNNFNTLQKRLHDKYIQTQQQIESLAVRASKTSSEVAANAYEKRMEEMAKEKIAIHEEITSYVNEQIDFRTALDNVSEYLSKPLKRWQEGDLDARRKLITMCFSKKIVYDRKNGFRTADLSLTYGIITGKKTLKNTESGHGGN